MDPEVDQILYSKKIKKLLTVFYGGVSSQVPSRSDAISYTNVFYVEARCNPIECRKAKIKVRFPTADKNKQKYLKTSVGAPRKNHNAAVTQTTRVSKISINSSFSCIWLVERWYGFSGSVAERIIIELMQIQTDFSDIERPENFFINQLWKTRSSPERNVKNKPKEKWSAFQIGDEKQRKQRKQRIFVVWETNQRAPSTLSTVLYNYTDVCHLRVFQWIDDVLRELWSS